jgi:quercetin dioxygenase-like cupin family protein
LKDSYGLLTTRPQYSFAGFIRGARGRTELRAASKCYPYDGLEVKTNPKNHNETRNVLDGLTHNNVHVDLHITTLGPGQMPHPAHTHVHEEMIMVQKGTLEVTILGKGTKIGPGSVAYVHSNELHGWKNIGDTPAEYFVLAIGKENT